MFISNGQFYVFLATIAIGGLCGIFFSLSALIKLKIQNVVLRVIPDVVAFMITFVIYHFISRWLSFPSFRAYMVLGVIVGIALYFKSFHILLAKCVKNLYNKCSKLYNSFKLRVKLRNERRDEQFKI